MATHPTIAAAAKAIETADVSDATDGATYFQTLAAATLRAVADQLDEHWAGTPAADFATPADLAAWFREICSEEGL